MATCQLRGAGQLETGNAPTRTTRLSIGLLAAVTALAAVAVPTSALAVQADDPGSDGAHADEAHVVEILPLEEETRLALSAAPAHLRDGAGVIALTADGFVTARETTNGFTCVVNRDHPLNRKPTCYDRVGTRSVLPRVRFVGERLLEGASLDDIEAEVARKFEAGEFVRPDGPGLAYMLSDEIRNYNASTGEVGTFPPHVMFYAPDLTNEEIGTSWPAMQDSPWLPFVGYEGPHGFLIVVVGDTGS